jgi:hypothetical protein
VFRHKGFVSDELFDRWIVASDVVVLPYRHVWSSGVLERAALYDKAVIATRIGGLAEQAAARDAITFVTDDDGLRRAMWERVAGGSADHAARTPLEPWPAEGDELREQVQRQIRRRAAGSRGSRAAAVAARSGSRSAEDAAALAGALSAPVRRLGELSLPPTTSQRSGAAVVKNMVRRLTAWELGPIVGEVNALRAATIEGLEGAGTAAGAAQAAAAREDSREGGRDSGSRRGNAGARRRKAADAAADRPATGRLERALDPAYDDGIDCPPAYRRGVADYAHSGGQHSDSEPAGTGWTEPGSPAADQPASGHAETDQAQPDQARPDQARPDQPHHARPDQAQPESEGGDRREGGQHR